MRSFAWIVVLLFFVSGSACLAAEGPVEAYCLRTTQDNAGYKNCIYARTAAATKSLVGRACSPSSCIYKLRCAKTICTGGGLEVVYKDRPDGTDITIKQAEGGVTELYQCGTCSSQEYASGPLKGASIRDAGRHAILVEVPK